MFTLMGTIFLPPFVFALSWQDDHLLWEGSFFVCWLNCLLNFVAMFSNVW